IFFKEIVIVFEEICKNYPRELWFSTVEDARQLGITKIDSFICDPFKEELYPSEEKLYQFEQFLNDVVQNSTLNSKVRLIIRNWDAIQALRLTIPKHVFERHQLIGLFLDGICADFVPSAVDEFNATEFEGVDIEGPIGLNITTLSLSGVNLTELAEKLRNDTEVDMILSRTINGSIR
uniref:DHC_N2 domain-containing protein n=1 Tax=Elaeophora elaphi TaxID=1147741 RepID=A0A0R3RYH3_9BILA